MPGVLCFQRGWKQKGEGGGGKMPGVLCFQRGWKQVNFLEKKVKYKDKRKRCKTLKARKFGCEKAARVRKVAPLMVFVIHHRSFFGNCMVRRVPFLEIV